MTKNLKYYLKHRKKFKKYYILILFIFYLNIMDILIKKIKNTKIAICANGKNENLYVKQFISYYLKLGKDHIFIYDDNEPNTEKFLKQ